MITLIQTLQSCINKFSLTRNVEMQFSKEFVAYLFICSLPEIMVSYFFFFYYNRIVDLGFLPDKMLLVTKLTLI